MNVTGFMFKNLIRVFEIIYEEAEKEYTDETPYKERLGELYYMLEKGEISEEEYEREEEEILNKLKEIRDYIRERDFEEEDEEDE